MTSEREVLEDVHAEPLAKRSRYSLRGMRLKSSGMFTCVLGNQSINPAAAGSEHSPSRLGAHGADFHSAPGIAGMRLLMLYCRPRRVMRRYVLCRRRLKMVPWLHGMTSADSPNTRNGYESVLMLMKGIVTGRARLYTRAATVLASQ